MKSKMIWCGAVCLFFATLASAQTKFTSTGKCSKPDVQQTAAVPDVAGHAYVLMQGKCVTKGDIGGTSSKEGAFTEHGEMNGNNGKLMGTYVETFASGDKVFYSYETTSTMKTGALQSGQNKWTMSGGTGKMKGIKGTGMCKLTGNAGGGLDYACTGEYTLASAAPAKK